MYISNGLFKKSLACSSILIKMRKQFLRQWNDACIYAMIISTLRQKVCKLRKLASSGGKFLIYVYENYLLLLLLLKQCDLLMKWFFIHVITHLIVL